MRFIVMLLVLAAIGYGGLYLSYDAGLTRATEAQLAELGLGDATVTSLDFSPVAPLSAAADVSAAVSYGRFQANVTLQVDGHPLFTEELSLGLDGFQGLSLGIGAADEA